jgi:hypothetical protein
MIHAHASGIGERQSQGEPVVMALLEAVPPLVK